MSDNLREIVGVFHDAASLEKAAQALMSSGVDRARLSLIATEATVQQKMGARFTPVEQLADDERTPRIAYADHDDVGVGEGALIGGLFYVGAVVGTGAVLASGGALLPAIAAAAAGGISGGGLGALLASKLKQGVANKVSDEVERGGVILWVRTGEGKEEDRALQIMRDSGAYEVHAHGMDDGVSV